MRIKAVFNKSDVRQHAYISFLEQHFPEIITEEDPELFYVIGGDGAMLHAHNTYQGVDIPFFGKGLGTVNFVMNHFDNDADIINGILNGSIVPEIVKTPKICVQVIKGDQEILATAINDIVIGGNIMDWNSFKVNSARGSFVNFTFQGMGICVSTPLGSTAFNLNNHGRMLPIDSGLWSVTSVSSNKNINELMKPQRVNIKISSPRCNPSIFIDGRANEIPLQKNDEVVIFNCDDEFKIAFLDPRDFFNKRMLLQQEKR